MSDGGGGDGFLLAERNWSLAVRLMRVLQRTIDAMELPRTMTKKLTGGLNSDASVHASAAGAFALLALNIVKYHELDPRELPFALDFYLRGDLGRMFSISKYPQLTSHVFSVVGDAARLVTETFLAVVLYSKEGEHASPAVDASTLCWPEALDYVTNIHERSKDVIHIHYDTTIRPGSMSFDAAYFSDHSVHVTARYSGMRTQPYSNNNNINNDVLKADDAFCDALHDWVVNGYDKNNTAVVTNASSSSSASLSQVMRFAMFPGDYRDYLDFVKSVSKKGVCKELAFQPGRKDPDRNDPLPVNSEDIAVTTGTASVTINAEGVGMICFHGRDWPSMVRVLESVPLCKQWFQCVKDHKSDKLPAEPVQGPRAWAYPGNSNRRPYQQQQQQQGAVRQQQQQCVVCSLCSSF